MTEPRDAGAAPTTAVDRRNARLYLTGLAASLVGNSAMILVAGIWVKSRTGSSALAAVVSACIYAPSLFGPLAGLLADRVRRRPLLVWINVASAVVTLPLLLVDPLDATWVIFVVMVGKGISLVLIDPAESALFAVMLPTGERQRVNGLRLAMQEGGKLVAPAAGAGLFALLGGGVVGALDATTFVIAAFAVLLLRLDEAPPARAAGTRWRTDLLAGFAFIRRDRVVLTILGGAAAAMAISAVVVAAPFALVDALGRSPSFLGVLTGALGAGSIVAGLTSGSVLRRCGEHTLLLLGLADGIVGYLLCSTGWLPGAVLGSAVLGFALPWSVIAAINVVQSRAPDHLQGRCGAALTVALFAPLPVFQLLSAALISPLGFRGLYLLGAAALLVTFALSFRRRRRTEPAAAVS